MKGSLGLSITEIIIAAGIFVLVIGFSLALMSNTSNSYLKSEDTMNSVQDASILIMRLRDDLSNLCQAPAEGEDLSYIRKDGGSSQGSSIDFRGTTGVLDVSLLASPLEEDGMKLSFWHYRNAKGERERVHYHYRKEDRAIERQVDGGPSKDYGVPRLEHLELSLFAQNKSDPQSSYTTESALELLREGEREKQSIVQLWFDVKLSMKSDEGLMRRKTSRIDISSKIFPRGMNKRLQGRWRRES